MKLKEESEKVGLKLNIQKTKIMAFGPITSWEIDGQKVETVLTLIFWAPKSATDFLRMDWLDLLAVQGTATFCPITNISLFPPPLHPGNHYSTLCLYVFRFLRLYTWYHALSSFLSGLFYLSYCLSFLSMLLQMVNIYRGIFFSLKKENEFS